MRELFLAGQVLEKVFALVKPHITKAGGKFDRISKVVLEW
jgi:predicted metalloprotease